MFLSCFCLSEPQGSEADLCNAFRGKSWLFFLKTCLLICSLSLFFWDSCYNDVRVFGAVPQVSDVLLGLFGFFSFLFFFAFCISVWAVFVDFRVH